MSAATRYAILNESHAPELTPAAISTGIVDALDAYDGPFASTWVVLPIELGLATAANDHTRSVHLVDRTPEAPDAEAYHTVDAQGRIVLRVAVETIREGLQPGQTLLGEIWKAITHEIFEAAIDPPCRLYCQVDGKVAMLAYEICDPCQGGSFKQGSTEISNFCFPAYWNPDDHDGPYDQCAQVMTPLSCAPGGYQAWSDGTQTFGEKVPERKKAQAIRFSRRAQKVRATAA